MEFKNKHPTNKMRTKAMLQFFGKGKQASWHEQAGGSLFLFGYQV
jgi:hypothetical protein